jgi:hypothetical protein
MSECPLHGNSTLSKANDGWEDLRGQMILRGTGRATLAGQVEGDGPDKSGYPGPPGWGLSDWSATSPRKKLKELWSLKGNFGISQLQKLLIFERKILRKILRPS